MKLAAPCGSGLFLPKSSSPLLQLTPSKERHQIATSSDIHGICADIGVAP